MDGLIAFSGIEMVHSVSTIHQWTLGEHYIHIKQTLQIGMFVEVFDIPPTTIFFYRLLGLFGPTNEPNEIQRSEN